MGRRRNLILLDGYLIEPESQLRLLLDLDGLLLQSDQLRPAEPLRVERACPAMARYAIAHNLSAILDKVRNLKSDLEALRKAQKAFTIKQRKRSMSFPREAMQEAALAGSMLAPRRRPSGAHAVQLQRFSRV